MVLGIFGASFLLVLGLTGSLLVYGKELQSFTGSHSISVEKDRLPLDELYKRLLTQTPEGSVAGWLLSDLNDQADQIWFHDLEIPSRESVYLLNPYNGNVIGKLKDNRSDSLYGFLIVLHYSLFLGGVGYFITGCFAFIYLLLVITGIKLYKRFWTSLIRLRWKESLQILFSDLHKFVGINAVWFHLILAITGGWWSLRDTIILRHTEEKVIHHLWNSNDSIDELVEKTKNEIPGFRLGYVSFPHNFKEEPIGIYGNRFDSSGFESRYGSYVRYDVKTKQIFDKVDISKESILNLVLDSFRPLHFGTFASHFSKVIWVMGGLTPAILSTSGVCIFYIKRKNKRRRTQKIPLSSSV
ncbi:PepSY domain-containing protein [Leptospira congkakensis]|uniref:PepSY domain-containing protein n=2 Tax=Leptospira congkakensis TaxID=2484932 RepID=A0A4Z1AB16_9LEPT|nr:PepSY domain-containing protein [Leptospira congkakensis]TGL89410.1 PepSY domain-containing protein [Leptospira congkakensis]TGL97376.1 PepSY domain-containing protein [Leptospira congkakensis]